MSYILDALRKAAEQRGTSSSVLFRPAPTQIGVARSWKPAWIAAGALLVVNVAVLIYLFRPVSSPDLPPRTASEPRAATTVAPTPPPAVAKATPTVPPVVSAPPPVVSAPSPAVASVPRVAPAPSTATPVLTPPPATPSVAAPQRPADLIPPPPAPVVRPTPKTAAPASGHRGTAGRVTPTEPRVTPTEPRVAATEPRAVAPEPRVVAPERPSVAPAPEPPASPRTRVERRGVIEPLPPVATTSPATGGGAPTGDRGRLKLEVVSYSETPAQRLVFISGRKYVEGDTTDGGFRVEQIREDSVVLSDKGERFTLR